MALAVHPPVERPPGPELGRLELLRLLRSRQLTSYLDRAVEVAPELAHFRIGREHAYLVGTPELVRELFGPLGRVGRKGRGLEQTRVLLGDGLLTSEGDLHRQQRRLIQPAFHATRIDAYARIMRTAAAELPERAGWADGTVRDMAPDMAALTLRIVGQTLFAADLTDDSTAVSAALAELLGRFQRVMVPGGALLNRLPLPSTRVLMSAIAELDTVVGRLIAEQRAGLGDDGTVLAMLLHARDEDGRPMPDRLVRDEVLTLMLAGHETTANSLGWCWERLVRNPEPHAALLEAVRRDEGAEERVEATITETMRNRPVIPIIGRRVQVPWRLGDYGVEPGTAIAMSILLVHHREDVYPDPFAFRPERWLGRKPGTYDWIPFGGGIRRCLGAALAMAEQRVVLTTMAKRLDLAAPTPAPERAMHRNVTMIPAQGATVVIAAKH